MAVTHKLEISFDPLSDLTPAWTDVSSRLLEVPSVKVGVDDDLSDMQAGSATFRLDNRDRALEPGYAAGAYYPNVRPLRRIRYLVNDGSTDWPQFFGYIVSWGPEWPGGMNQETIIQAVDGTMILEMDNLPSMDPPTASTYEEVVTHDDPWGYWGLGDPAGTRAFARFKRKTKKGKRVRSGTRYETASAAEGVAGAAGVYKNNPGLGAPSGILGSADTSVVFNSALSHYVRVPVEVEDLIDSNRLSASAWVNFATIDAANGNGIVAGPYASAVTRSAWRMILADDGGSTYVFRVVLEFTNSTALNVSANLAAAGIAAWEWFHAAFSWNGDTLILYLNGVEVSRGNASGVLRSGTVSDMLIGAFTYSGAGTPQGFFSGSLDEIAVYEKVLPPERVLAHYLAGAERGFIQETTGFRIVGLADNPLWSTAFIQTTGHDLAPAMKYGQSRFDEIREAARSDLPSGLFYFAGTANPRYLAWDYGDTAPYNTVEATLGNNPGEIPFVDAQTTDEDELYNIVTTSREGGLAQTVRDEGSIGEFYDRGYELSGLAHAEDHSCLTVSHAILSEHSQPEPPVRIQSVTLTNDVASAQAEILERMPGDLIRVKHRPKGGTAIDIITRIRGRTLTVSPLDGGNRVISCTWTLARGFNAAVAEWRLGVTGYSELQTTTVLG